MKRIELVQRLVKEGMSEKTLANFSDKQIISLSERMLGEQSTTSGKGFTNVSGKNPQAATIAKTLNSQGVNVNVTEEDDTTNQLKGGQKKLDKNHNGKIDGQDFKILKGQKKEVKEDLKGGQKKIDANHNGKIDGQDFKILKGKKEDMKEADMGLTIKAPKSSGSVFGAPVKKASSGMAKKKTTPKKKEGEKTEEGDVDESLNGLMIGVIKDKLTKDLGREPEDHEMDKAHKDFVNNWIKNDQKKKEKHNSKGDKKKEDVDELLRFYDDDGNPIKNKKGEQDAVSTKHKDFEKKTKSKKCPDCGEHMKDCKCDHSHLDENRKIKNWVNNLVENEKYHSFTSKNEIMELIQSKINESETMMASVGPRVKKGHNGVPEFMTYEAIKSGGPAVAPTKPKPGTKPGTNPGTKPKTPYRPGIKPSPKPKASFE